MKTLLIVRPANGNLFILLFHQSNKVVACDCHCFNNCLIRKVCAQISNSLSYTQISKRPSAANIEMIAKGRCVQLKLILGYRCQKLPMAKRLLHIALQNCGTVYQEKQN